MSLEKIKGIHRAGKSTLYKTFAIFTFVNAVLLFFYPIIFYIVAPITLIIYIVLLNFFRVPLREPYLEDGCIISPADGKVVVIEPVEESEYFKDKRLQVSIFMNVANVHINWSPINGIISFFRHHNGNHMAAFLPKSSIENERSTIVINNEKYGEVLMRQVAGAMARRVVTYLKEGQRIGQSDEVGFIKLGSRIDLYLPLDTKVEVNMEDKVVGSRTVIARLIAK